jgi:nitrogen fixation NifU-like protein
MMTLKLKGKPRPEAERVMELFKARITGPEDDPAAGNPGPRELGDLNVLVGVRKFPQRVKCAMLAWRAFEQALQENDSLETKGTVSTEDLTD